MTKMNADSAISVKVSFNGEMRRFPFQGTSYAALHEHLLQILGLDKSVELTLKYADEDNDLITISSDLELESAVMPNQVLRLDVAPKNRAAASASTAAVQPPVQLFAQAQAQAQAQPQPQHQHQSQAPQPQLQPQAIPAPFMGHGHMGGHPHGFGHGFGHGHGHGHGHGYGHGQGQGQGAEVTNQPFGGWPHPPHHYHHLANDWQAFKELRKHDKKAFTREEWQAFKEQRKKEKKDLKEHFKGQKEWHKKDRKEWKNWHGAVHAARHGGGGQYFGPNGGAFQSAPTQASPVAAQVPSTPTSSTTVPQDVAKEVNMTDVPIDDGASGSAPTPTAPAATAAQAQSQPASPSVGPFSPHMPPPPFGAGYPPSPFGVPHVPPPHFGVPPPPFGMPHVPPPPFSFGPHPHPHPPPPFGFPFGPFGVPSAKLIARHVKDVTIEDGTKVAAGSQFIKTWRVRNEGAPWPAGCALLFLNKGDGDSMNAPEKVVVEGPVATNQEVEISVSLVAPSKPGRYTGYWKMSSPDGRKFGQRMWVTIVVPSLGSSSSEGEKEADRYEALVDAVLAMGFDAKRHRVFRLLQKHDGDVALVCQALQEKAEKAVRKEAKKANHDAEKAQRDVEKAQRKAMKQAEKAARKNAMKD